MTDWTWYDTQEWRQLREGADLDDAGTCDLVGALEDEAQRARTRLQRAEEVLTDVRGALDRLSRLGTDQSEAVSKIDSIDAFLGERND